MFGNLIYRFTWNQHWKRAYVRRSWCGWRHPVNDRKWIYCFFARHFSRLMCHRLRAHVLYCTGTRTTTAVAQSIELVHAHIMIIIDGAFDSAHHDWTIKWTTMSVCAQARNAKQNRQRLFFAILNETIGRIGSAEEWKNSLSLELRTHDGMSVQHTCTQFEIEQIYSVD